MSESLLVDLFVLALESEGLEVNAIPDGGPVVRVTQDHPELGKLVVRRVGRSVEPDDWFQEAVVGDTIQEVFKKVVAQMPSTVIDKVQAWLSDHVAELRKAIRCSADVHFALNIELAKRGPRT